MNQGMGHVDGDGRAERREFVVVPETQVAGLTGLYVDALGKIQDDFDSKVEKFASRLLEDAELKSLVDSTSHANKPFNEMCSGFLTGVSHAIRREIPSDVPRPQRRNIKELTIDWTKPNPEACWHNTSTHSPATEVFGITSLLKFAAEHSAGMPDNLQDRVVELTLPMIKSGELEIPRLRLTESKDGCSKYYWESANVTISE